MVVVCIHSVAYACSIPKTFLHKCTSPHYPCAINLTTSTQTHITMKTDIIRGIKTCNVTRERKRKRMKWLHRPKENITYGNKVNQNPLWTWKVRKNNIKQLLLNAPTRTKGKKWIQQLRHLHQNFFLLTYKVCGLFNFSFVFITSTLASAHFVHPFKLHINFYFQ